MDAALAEGAGVIVYPSFAPVYADGGARWLSVGDPVAPTAVLRSTLLAEEEVARFVAAGGRGVVLRMAGVYGTYSDATRDVLALARRGLGLRRAVGGLPVTGVGRGCRAALVAAAVTPAAFGAYDVADDEPLTRARLAEVLGAVVGRAVHRPPTWLARAALGSGMEFLLRSQRESHLAFTEATGWLPQVRSAADGLPPGRRGTQSCRSSSARARSAGYGLVNSTHCPSAGCSNPSSRACSHCRSSRSRFASTGSAP